MSEDTKYTAQVNVKLSPEYRIMLEVVAKFETRRLSELVREWVMDKMRVYGRNPQFRRWLKFHPEERERIQTILP